MHATRHALLLTVAAIRSIPERLGTSAVTVISISTVMGVLVAMLALGQGLEGMVQAGVRADQAVVLSSGAQSALQSSLPKTILGSIADKPGIRRDAAGKPLVAGAIFIFIDAVNRQNQRGTVSLYSATPEWREIWPEVHMIEGRFFRPGLHELIVSDRVRQRFRHLDVGDEVRVRGTPWKIVGAYKSSTSAFDNSVVGDADTVLSAFPQATFNVVNAIVDSPSAFATFAKAVTSDPTLSAEVKTLAESNDDIIKPLRQLLDFISYFLGGLMGLGAACGALASLYAAVDARTGEIATFRAIGFGAVPVVVSVLAEGLVLAIPAALLGAGIDWYLFNRHIVVAQGITFTMAVTPNLVVIALCWALCIALIGGVLPSIRAARLPVATAMRAG
ncbi:MAG TPA: ABC transporter permease [Steroidobacteraceae bacterium]|nr:ABC transporter permease [Steroidobacteraceae bacterium]